jgi:hypothetical protein
MWSQVHDDNKTQTRGGGSTFTPGTYSPFHRSRSDSRLIPHVDTVQEWRLSTESVTEGERLPSKDDWVKRG